MSWVLEIMICVAIVVGMVVISIVLAYIADTIDRSE